MRRLFGIVTIYPLFAQAFVCETETYPVIKHSDVDMAADITALDTPQTIAAKKAYEQAVISVVGLHRIMDNPNDKQELAIIESVMAYKGPVNLEAITAYTKALPHDIIVKSYVMTRLGTGTRADCYELNDPEFQDIIKWIRKECDEESRALFPNTLTVDIKAGSREVCSSVGGGRSRCREFNMNSCSPSTCR